MQTLNCTPGVKPLQQHTYNLTEVFHRSSTKCMCSFKLIHSGKVKLSLQNKIYKLYPKIKNPLRHEPQNEHEPSLVNTQHVC